MASLIRWTWVWVNSRSWWWTGRPGVLRVTKSRIWLNDWTEVILIRWYCKLMNYLKDVFPRYRSQLLYIQGKRCSGRMFSLKRRQKKNCVILLANYHILRPTGLNHYKQHNGLHKQEELLFTHSTWFMIPSLLLGQPGGSKPKRWHIKSFKLVFNSMWTENFQIYKLDLEKAEESEIKLSTSARS